MSLPKISPSQLDMQPVDLRGVPARFANPGEREVIIALLRSVKAIAMVEFGVNSGGTSLGILRNMPTIGCYVGIDVEQGYIPAKAVQRGEVPNDPGALVADRWEFHLLTRPRGSFDIGPDDILEFTRGMLLDAAFIDGDHGRAGVINDTRLARAVVRPGGIIIWHDYHELGTVDVKEVLDEMHAAGAPINHVAGTWLAYEKLPEASHVV